MALHHTQKKKYIGLKEQGLTAQKLVEQMQKDGIAPAEVDAFVADAFAVIPEQVTNTAIIGAVQPPPAPVGDEFKAGVPYNVADPIPSYVDGGHVPTPSAPQFNYKGLVGDHYKEYELYINSLPLFGLRDFQVFKAEPVMQERYPGMRDSPRDMVGVRIINDTPIHTTRITPQTAKEMNAQLTSARRYYLLKS